MSRAAPPRGLFSRVRSWFASQGEEPELPAEEAPPPHDETSDETRATDELTSVVAAPAGAPTAIRRLARVGLADGPTVEEAMAVLRQVRGTVLEADAVSWALRDLGTRIVPDPIRVACVDILASRGDEAGALRMLEGVSSTPGLILASDLYAGSGQLARAVGTIERVLARDISAPGARERHQRWSAALGYVPSRARASNDDATVVAAQPASGPFRLLREVARGGAGAVYEAEDEVLGRKVAFKVYHGRGKDKGALQREARMAARLTGPGVVRLLDADPEAGWVAFEWIARGSMRDVLRAGDLAPLAAVSTWARPLARALARVHAEGVVHADVKPANVLLRQPNDPVLGDFGIARREGAPSDGGGSAGYLSPERLAGRPSDLRDDVYGFGRVLEDVLHRLDEASGAADAHQEEERAAYRALALRCVGPEDGRPANGAELVRALPGPS